MTVRLQINLADDVAAVLRGWMQMDDISATEAVRRAIAVWNFMRTEIAAGGKLAVVETDGRIREVILRDAGGEE